MFSDRLCRFSEIVYVCRLDAVASVRGTRRSNSTETWRLLRETSPLFLLWLSFGVFRLWH